MVRNWQQVSLEEARKNPLYGVKNWLAVFAFGVLMVPLRELSELNSAAYEAGISLSALLALNDGVGAYAKSVLAFETLMAAVIFLLLFTKHWSFRHVASIFLLASYPLYVTVAFATELPSAAGGSLVLLLFPWILSCAVWVTYLQRSRRVRVTFENSVLVETQQLPSTPIQQLPTLKLSPVSEPRQPPHLQPSKATHSPLPPAATSPTSPTIQADTEETFWSQALTEFEGASRRQGLWARVFAEADGNEAIAKARYLRERGPQIAEEERKRQDELADKVAVAKRAATELKVYIGKMSIEFVSGAAWPLEYIGDLVGAVEIQPSLMTLADRTHGRTLLHWCAKYNLAREALVLVKHGANTNVPDGNGRRPYELAENLELRELLRAAATTREVAAVPRQL